MYKNVPQCNKNVPLCIKMYLYELKCTSIYKNVPQCIKMYLNV